jgi:hypothetical protein
MNNTGMRLGTRGLTLTGEQIVHLSTESTDEIFILNNGALTSYKYDITASGGFVPSGTATKITADIASKQKAGIGNPKIMEIAGGNTLKIRYDNGTCLEASVSSTYGTVIVLEKSKSCVRVTKNDIYVVPAIINHYRIAGVGGSLIPLFEDSAGKAKDIVAVFEGAKNDNVVTLSSVTGLPYAIVDMIGTTQIVTLGVTLYAILGGTKVPITGYGTIVRKMVRTRNITMYEQVPSTSPTAPPTKVDYSAMFSPEHYAYITLKRTDHKTGWAGVGNTGYVVDNGDTVIMNVPIIVPSNAINNEIHYIETQNGLEQVDANGLLTPLNITTLDGLPLIKHIYNTDMTKEVVMDANRSSEMETFNVNGYYFGYGAGHKTAVVL